MPEPSIPDVRKSVTVAATPEHCFHVFTERLTDWWPPTHVLVTKQRTGLAFEPRVGGRYYEWDIDGTEAVWGRVLAWEPPNRIALTWRVDGSWQSLPDDERASQIEVAFIPIDAWTTRVELVHLKLHKHGADAQRIFQVLDGPNPGETLERFAKAVAAAPPRPGPVDPSRYLGIQRFYAGQMQLLDSGLIDEWTATFAVDGVFEVGGQAARGRDQIGPAARKVAQEFAARNITRRHWLGMLTADQDGDVVRACCYALVLEIPQGGDVIVRRSTVCDDTLVESDGAWFVRHRTVTRDGLD